MNNEDRLIQLTIHERDIKYMKETLDKHTDDISDIKKSQHEVATSVKGLDINFNEFMRIFKKDSNNNKDTRERVDILEVKFNKIRWFFAGSATILTTLGTLCAIFAKKIALLFGIIL